MGTSLMVQQIGARVDGMSVALNTVQSAITNLQGSVANLEERVKNKFDSVDLEFNGVKTRMEEVVGQIKEAFDQNTHLQKRQEEYANQLAVGIGEVVSRHKMAMQAIKSQLDEQDRKQQEGAAVFAVSNRVGKATM